MILTLVIFSAILVAISTHVALAIGIGCCVSLAVFSDIPLAAIPHKMVNGIDRFVFLAIPLFLLAGRVMNAGGITDRLFKCARVWVGSIPGGLAHANVVASMLFAWMNGSAVATAGGLGEIEVRAMRENGYDVPFAASVAAAASVLGPIIPPSIPLVIYAAMTEESVGRLFLGGIVPGVLMGLALMVLIHCMARARNYPRDRRPSLRQKLVGTRRAIVPLLMPVFMLGGMVTGRFTPTEAAAVAAAYTLAISLFLYRTVKVRDLPGIFVDAMIATSVVTFIISTTSVFSFQLSVADVGEKMGAAVLAFTHNKYVVLLMLNLLLLLLGAVVETGAVLILFIPILYPLVTSPEVGVDPVHLGVIMAVNLMIGVVTPPMGMCLFILSHVGKLKPEVLMRAILPFLIPLVATLMAITYGERLVLFVPDLFLPRAAVASPPELPPACEPAEIRTRNETGGSARLVKVGVDHSRQHSFTRALMRFGRDLEARTDGRFHVKVYCGGQLGSEKVLQEMLTLGTTEMTVTGLLNTYDPRFTLFEMPYLYRDREHAMEVLAGPVMAGLAESLPRHGFRLIGVYENGFRHITNSRRPIYRPSDLAGLKTRVPENPAEIETMRALGADPVAMPYSDLYAALLLGTVQGQENPLQNIWSGRLFEAQKHLAMTAHIYNSAYVLISESFWQTLSDEDRQVFRECFAESSRWQLEFMKHRDIELEGLLQDSGMEITRPDRREFEEACRPAYHVVFKRLGAQAKDTVDRIRNTGLTP
ncbi:MAG TPA: TRAP transporter large permease subunit [Sedimentisphaerales bacterium]|jgi:tripartite ATP-independent transporter DctM subunit/tripartite ATP-independent transporter DctP family solute receptor|nr:TRAP transporter large permease subunit [Sedimentisphaerales bacterium]HNU28885.1 TRAP transporter large permease subunit [Sedimentisphaerales bacterium]